MLDGTGCETAEDGGATGAGCTTAGAGGGVAGAGRSDELSAALSILDALATPATRTARQALAATTARPISSLVILFMSSDMSCRAPLRSSSTLLAEATV
jgi:hypothetical protein